MNTSTFAAPDAGTEQQPQAAPHTLTLPALQAGERYAGLVLSTDGAPSHHLVLRPGQANGVTWQAAQAWATEQGGELPTRMEQALLYANLKAKFEPRWYWSREVYAGAYAWGQDFNGGHQDVNRQSYGGRARAVRRVTASVLQSFDAVAP